MNHPASAGPEQLLATAKARAAALDAANLAYGVHEIDEDHICVVAKSKQPVLALHLGFSFPVTSRIEEPIRDGATIAIHVRGGPCAASKG